MTIGFSGLLASSAFAQFTGPTSPYYLDSSATLTIYVVQGTSVINSFAWAYGADANGDPYNEGTLAVSGTVNTRSYESGAFGLAGLGGQYTLGGVPTGLTEAYPAPAGSLGDFSYDGTSDGTSNYYVQYYGFDGVNFSENVYRTDLSWQNPQLLFSAQSSPGDTTEYLGIAFDPANDSLWISGWSDSTISDYSLSGTLLSSFTPLDQLGNPQTDNGALGYDAADGTLWLTNDETNLLEQYSTTGTLLQFGTPAGLPAAPGGGYLAGDFASSPVPEPASLLLLATMVAGLFYARRRKNFQV